MSPGYDTSEQMRTEKENEKGRAARYPTRKSTRRAMELRSPWARMSTAAAQRGSSLRYGHLRRRPLDHLDVPTVTALEELNRWQAGAQPRKLSHELHAHSAVETELGSYLAPHTVQDSAAWESVAFLVRPIALRKLR